MTTILLATVEKWFATLSSRIDSGVGDFPYTLRVPPPSIIMIFIVPLLIFMEGWPYQYLPLPLTSLSDLLKTVYLSTTLCVKSLENLAKGAIDYQSSSCLGMLHKKTIYKQQRTKYFRESFFKKIRNVASWFFAIFVVKCCCINML